MSILPPRPDDRSEATPAAPGASADTPAAPALAASLRWAAHEINSLLDGSMRSLCLAQSALVGASEPECAEALARLRTAHGAMIDMAAVLKRAMTEGGTGPELLRSDRTLGEEIDRLHALLAPMAEQEGVKLDVIVDAAAAALPAGLLGPVLVNGIRNAIEACAAARGGSRRVEASVTLAGDRLDIVIADNGRGLGDGRRSPGGHGIGLAVCRNIVSAMGGRLELTSVPYGEGAVLHAVVPCPGGKAA